MTTKGTHGDKVLPKRYEWAADKNEQLRRQRGVSFEDVVSQILAGNEVDVIPHPNQERYPGQSISIVVIGEYAYLVPFVESEGVAFLKTIFPSRKATRRYVGESK